MTQFHLKKQVILKKNEDHRIIRGHPWVFSNEVREIHGAPAIGDIVEILNAAGLTLGTGFFNPHSLICCRLLSKQFEEIDEAFFHKRIEHALRLRRRLYTDGDAYRLVHGEGDFLPGLIVDRFNDYISVQTLSYGMDQRLAVICDVLESLLHPSGIVERNESPLRLLEQLPQKKGILRGTAGTTTIADGGLRYTVNVLEGQKTGFFLDQRENRLAVRRFARGASVLDCFCNEGGFALNAAAGGAVSVLGVEVSSDALVTAAGNAALNGITSVEFVQSDVFEKLESLAASNAQFDVVILDPPSFTKSRKNVQSAKKGYRELHVNSLRVLRPGGYLLTSSCSHHIEPEVFLDIISEAARASERRIQILDWRGAAPDHPTLPAVPETRYLKFGIFRVYD